MSTWKTTKIKAKITDYGDICKRAQKLSGGPPEILKQVDTYYDVPHGFLKIQTNADFSGKILSYDSDGPTRLHRAFTSVSTAVDLLAGDAQQLALILEESLGSTGQVSKERKLYKVHDDFNIYIDIVDDIGKFVKVEMLHLNSNKLKHIETEMKEMQKRLGISDEKLISDSYLILSRSNEPASE